MNKRRIIMSIVTAGVLFTGCGGGGGSTNSTPVGPTSTTLSGNIVDGAIEGAIVRVQCQDNYLPQIYTSLADGTFSLTVNKSESELADCVITATGGKDVETGNSLSGLTLKTPYSLSNTTTGINVTPITTAIAELTEDNVSIEDAKTTISGILNIDEERLKEDPTKIGGELAKVALSLTEIAIKEGKFVDFNAEGNKNPADVESLKDYIENESTLNIEDKEELKNKLEALANLEDNADIDAIVKASHSAGVFQQLVNAYKLSENDLSNAELKTNLEYLASEIVESNSITDTTTQEKRYKVVSTYHLRKALTDTELLPAFKDDGDEATEDKEIEDALKTTLSSNENDFKTYVGNKTIDIVNINGFVLFDSSSYEVEGGLGDDEEARRNYYTYSDKSNVAKAVSLAENNFSIAVNDPINTQVANGLGRLGFYEEGLRHIGDNVYGNGNLQDGYRNLGRLFLDLGKNDFAARSFSKEYETILKSTASSVEGDFPSEEKTNLPFIVRYLTEAGYYDDNKSLNITGANTVINRVESYANYYADHVNDYSEPRYAVADYQVITNLIDDLATDIITYDNNISNAKTLYSKNIALSENFPVDNVKSTDIFHLSTVAIHGTIFGLDTSSIAEKVFGTVNSPRTLSSSNQAYKVIYDALNRDYSDANNMQTTLNELNALSGTTIDDVINRGLGAVLFLNNQKDALFNDYYEGTYDKSGTDTLFYTYSNKDRLMQYNTQLKPTNIMPTAMAIRLLGEDSDLKDYLDRLRVLADTWAIDIDDTVQDEMNLSDALKVFAQWSDKYNSRYGYLAIASMYKDIGEDQSAKTTINEAIAKIKTFPDTATEKTTGLLNIWAASKELGYEEEINVADILTIIYNSALISEDVENIVTIANVLSSNGDTVKAKTLVDRAYTVALDELKKETDAVKKVQAKVMLFVGNYSETNSFETSIANAYFQLGDKVKAKEMIASAYTSIKTLSDDLESINTGTQYKELIHVIVAYGRLNDLDSLKPLIAQIKTINENEIARVEAAQALAEFDSFTGNNVASIDSDGDGKPDFFNLNASKEEINNSGLTLDDDIDGDGKEATGIDTLPYDNI